MDNQIVCKTRNFIVVDILQQMVADGGTFIAALAWGPNYAILVCWFKLSDTRSMRSMIQDLVFNFN